MTRAEYQRRWHLANMDKVRKNRRLWKQKNRSKVRAQKRRWYKKHALEQKIRKILGRNYAD